MNVEAVDFFYLAMPVVTDAGDGSQDALVVRVSAGGLTGWGECPGAFPPVRRTMGCSHSNGCGGTPDLRFHYERRG